MLDIGDKVVYPMHGAGIIEAMEEKYVLGTKKQYYILKISMGNIKVMLPVDHVGEIGVRDLSPSHLIDEVFIHIKNCEDDMSGNWNKRYRDNLNKIRTGDIFEVATIVKFLSLRDREKGLSAGEKKMLNNAKQILYSEIILCKNLSQCDVESVIEDLISNL